MTPDRPARRLRLERLEDRSVPATFNVTTTADAVDPADGKRSLREAITQANANPDADVIVLPAGVYKLALAGAGEDGNASGDLDLTGPLTIRGAGAGRTIIDGRQLDRVFDVLGTAASPFAVVLRGLAVRNGNAAGDGGGVRAADADLVVRDCAVTGNRASEDGGGVHSSGPGSVSVVRTAVARNVAGALGGGLHVASGGELAVRASTISRNVAANFGGGINASSLTVAGSTVSGNTVLNFDGGGIDSSTATLTNSTVSGNHAAGDGGGLHTGTATLTNCTFSGNHAAGDGGGVWAFSRTALTNCTISGNSAGTLGGGVWAQDMTLLSVTVVENSAGSGGGLYFSSNLVSSFTLRNSLIALNLVGFPGVGPDVAGDFSDEVFTSGGHNLIGDGTGGAGFIDSDLVGTAADPIDPKLGPLANNGGRTKTHKLLAGSPCIDAGDNAALPPTDQRGPGFPRKKDGNGDGIAVVDIGAVER
jgi:CSLREA domain-containing protein